MEIERSDGEYMCARINGCGKCAPITRTRDSERKKDEKISSCESRTVGKQKLRLNNH